MHTYVCEKTSKNMYIHIRINDSKHFEIQRFMCSLRSKYIPFSQNGDIFIALPPLHVIIIHISPFTYGNLYFLGKIYVSVHSLCNSSIQFCNQFSPSQPFYYTRFISSEEWLRIRAELSQLASIKCDGNY